MFISFKKPFKPISRDTLSRWTKQVLEASSINMDQFKPHSIRMAATSKAFEKDVSLATIMKCVGWKKAETVARFYNKPIEDGKGFAEAVLEEHK